MSMSMLRAFRVAGAAAGLSLLAAAQGCYISSPSSRPPAQPWTPAPQQPPGYYGAPPPAQRPMGSPPRIFNPARKLNPTPPATYTPGETVLASAPAGIDDGFLGIPVNDAFQPYVGGGAGSLFPQGRVARMPEARIDHEYAKMDDTLELAANAAAWGIGSASAGFGYQERHSAYRAFQIEYVSVLDDRTAMRVAPPGAKFYPWKIYYGRSFEAVVHQSAEHFTAALEAEFEVATVGIDVFTQQRQLKSKYAGKGFRPKPGKGALFARTQAEIRDAYDSDTSQPVPIFVEYRQIPNAPVSRQPIAWSNTSGPVTVDVIFDRIQVIEDGTWFSTQWSLYAFCTVNQAPYNLQNPTVWSGAAVNKNNVYPIGWSTRLTVPQGALVQCGLRGTFGGGMKSGQIAEGRMVQPLAAQRGMNAPGTFDGFNSDTRYKAFYHVAAP